MKYFVSAGEPSGELHGSNLMKKIRELDPRAQFTGFGGSKMADAGCRLIYPLADKPIIGVLPAIRAIPHLRGVLANADAYFQTDRPDAVILIDNPGFNWEVAKRAKKRGIPVIYYVPPQIWAWLTYRVKKMKRLADLVLCSLPFEEAWYEQRGVHCAHYVGHPYFDSLAERTYDEQFIAAQQKKYAGKRIVALLPGSRRAEVEHNTNDILRAAQRIVQQTPDVQFLVAGFRKEFASIIDREMQKFSLPVEVHYEKTPEIMKLAHVAVSVSGSVSMELMYHAVPTVIVYRLNWMHRNITMRYLLQSPFITLVNLIAGGVVYPEFPDCRDRTEDVAQAITGWLHNEGARAKVVHKLQRLRSLYAFPGASAQAAHQILSTIRGPMQRAKAA